VDGADAIVIGAGHNGLVAAMARNRSVTGGLYQAAIGAASRGIYR
jgi:tRNA U34 5-carboxymethylaminomethyl modifying enzyme MnmG/GidA